LISFRKYATIDVFDEKARKAFESPILERQLEGLTREDPESTVEEPEVLRRLSSKNVARGAMPTENA
jgi:hypothetical protein